MTLQDITPDNYRDLPQIPFADVKLLWHDNFWDGPLSGLLLWRNERLWFQMQEEYEPPGGVEPVPWPWYRRFLVIRLTAGQLGEEEQWHELFRRCVGTHTDYRHDETTEPATVHPKEQWAEFYDAYNRRVPPNLSANEVVGWFER